NLNPFFEKDTVAALAHAGVIAISMSMMPRTTIAQKMDTLSSQANLGGYVAVVLAAERLNKIFPMMMTPSGTIPPARVFVIGVGVAGLQAIATAKRLGARVE
ncbi:NAD(P)(+) transhydrogenase (Re/Si-specific) subunit alpha, partial [Arthrospira platensis SPKY1]|nr:NAD(P)(+) transhydrogenase (Re/Si-specific) subunit alpha [Arthrospira platensis SPKY1]